jgi:hypothetical protein
MDKTRIIAAQRKLVGLRHLSGSADGIWGHGSQAALDNYAVARSRQIRKCLTHELAGLLDAEQI